MAAEITRPSRNLAREADDKMRQDWTDKKARQEAEAAKLEADVAALEEHAPEQHDAVADMNDGTPLPAKPQ